jgi:hypothetical protein
MPEDHVATVRSLYEAFGRGDVATIIDAVDPDPERLAAMSDVAARSLPTGMTLSGTARPGQSAKVVLLGGGGGTWTVPLALGDPGGPPAVTVVADVVDFCRVAATRLPPESLDHDVEGDVELAREVLRAVAIFAA